jgi:hypothetical protein
VPSGRWQTCSADNVGLDMTVPERLANRELDASVRAPLDAPPERARVVIVGGGIIPIYLVGALAVRPAPPKARERAARVVTPIL